jgi:hypothetical protein
MQCRNSARLGLSAVSRPGVRKTMDVLDILAALASPAWAFVPNGALVGVGDGGLMAVTVTFILAELFIVAAALGCAVRLFRRVAGV